MIDFKNLFFENVAKLHTKVKRYGNWLKELVNYIMFKESIIRLPNFNIDNEEYIRV